MNDRRSDQNDGQGAGTPERASAEVIPFRRPAKPVTVKKSGSGGPVIGPRSRIAHKLRMAESATYGALFSLVALTLEAPLSALPYMVIALALGAGAWFSLSPRRGAIDNGTVVVTALATALAGWLAYAAIKGVIGGGGILTVFTGFANGMAYAMVVGWPAAIVAGLITRQLSAQWRPRGRR
ncbi:hypothetical protein [Zavarzinia sp.]|uniref:hypothetical protein n=1 Tax=Zavarzinia sp. TaxID=2027920 RepID=UPI003BB7EDFE